MTNPPTAIKNDDIEVLRAVAIVFTLLCHLHNMLTWNGPLEQKLPWVRYWGGVDLFFCVSGFVIAGSLLRAPPRERFRDMAIPFYIRRIYRIWPAALCWLIIAVLAAAFFNHTGAFGRVGAVLIDAAAAACNVANIYFSTCTGTQYGACGKESIYWSLSLEEQFYLVFPLLLYMMRPRHLRILLLLSIGAQFFIPRPPDQLLWYFRTDAICYGVLIALAHRDAWMQRCKAVVARHPARASWCAAGLMLALMAISVFPALEINAGLLAAVAAGLVLIASSNLNLILPWQTLRPVLLWIGSRSFAIYLAHNPCFWGTHELFGRLLRDTPLTDRMAPWYILTALTVTLLASEATYRLVETPLRNIGRRLAHRYEAGAKRNPAGSGIAGLVQHETS